MVIKSVKNVYYVLERLAEGLKTSCIHPVIHGSVFLCFRVLILKFSSANLSALWPIIIHEVVQVLLQLEKLVAELSPEWLGLSLEVMKLIELLITLQPTQIPLFQMYKWAFVPTKNNNNFTPILTRIANAIHQAKDPTAQDTGATAQHSIAQNSIAQNSIAQDTEATAQDSIAQDSIAQDSIAQDTEATAQDSIAQDSLDGKGCKKPSELRSIGDIAELEPFLQGNYTPNDDPEYFINAINIDFIE